MAFSRDWLEINPIDHLKFKSISGEVREFKVDVSDRLKTILSGFVSGDTLVGIKLGKYLTNGTAAPTAPSGTGTALDINVYCRTIGTGTYGDLYIRNTTGGELRLTNGDKIRAESIGGVYPATNAAALATIMNLIYPIGIVITLGVATNPATLLGIGTWTAMSMRFAVPFLWKLFNAYLCIKRVAISCFMY